jgi:hypothetical protein
MRVGNVTIVQNRERRGAAAWMQKGAAFFDEEESRARTG